MKPSAQQIQNIIEKGLAFLSAEQTSRGDFPCHAFTSDGQVADSLTVFGTALIANSLSGIASEALLIKATDFLKRERHEDGSWNYWQKAAPQYTAMPYPNDIDDMALALAAIVRHEPSYMDGEMLARLVHILTQTELAEGGPYNTWIIDHEKEPIWKDCDIVVNANIASMLSLVDVKLPSIVSLIDDAIEQGAVRSCYYVSPVVCFYFISISYHGKRALQAIDLLLEMKKDGHWDTPLHTAMAIVALRNFGYDISNEDGAFQYLIETCDGGQWPMEAICLERKVGPVEWFHGSPSITTAYCLEALSLVIPAAVKNHTELFEKERSVVIDRFVHHVDTVSSDFGVLARAAAEKMLSHAVLKESIALPFFFLDAQDNADEKYQHIALRTSFANLHGWIGYTLIDDIMDGEKGPEYLPFATYCIRVLISEYAAVFEGPLPSIVSDILNGIEMAYSNEHQTRLKILDEDQYDISSLPDCKMLPTFQKSLGHALPVIAILLRQGNKEDGLLIQQCLTFFRHYLHARQSNDDAHDIAEDLMRGHVTLIGHRVLSAYKEQYPEKTTYGKQEETAMLDLFWNDLFPETYDEINRSIISAREALAGLGLPNPAHFEKILAVLQSAQDKALRERTIMQDFLKAY